LNSKDIRKSFLDFFRDKDHRIVPSSPVVPYNDPTLLFTNAGMNQFKDVFLSTGTRDYSRAADTQKCIRAGGKHNDLEEVGMDGYHHTFFEMLGNWSFGDYYKKEAIQWAWELLTDVWKLPKEKLWVSVFETDDEAFDIWKNETDIDPSHILRFGEKDNFWEMGDTGPCGPCSEIHFDFTESGCKPEDVNAGLEDVIEIWNLVFIQYDRKKDRKLVPLPKKHIDTGMGFERIVRVLQNKRSNYETDVFLPIVNKITEITGKKYEGENVSSVNAIADHIRALTFAISDGAIPSNEGRGYVLRRILRRASRLARKLDYHKPVLFQLVDTVTEHFGEAFPELKEKNEFTKEVIQAEEESFNVTLDRGIKLFNEVTDSLKGTKIFPGDDAFKLYDTYGFPVDLTQVMAGEKGLKVDMLKFEEEMEKQKERGRDARKEKMDIGAGIGIFDFLNENLSEQVSYDPYLSGEFSEDKTIAVGKTEDGKLIAVLNNNPFFSESGGQISDTGKIITDNDKEIDILDSQKYFLILNDKDNFLSNSLKENELIPLTGKIILDHDRRRSIERNHSATHIVHEALRRVLGSHVKQLGSLVHNEYLRFDFPHFHKLTGNEILEIEAIVNSKIKEQINVITDVDISIEEANKIPNVKKIFGDKYGDKVRVVRIDDNFSVEFCGGTHVSNTSDIGLFKIIKEESIASGTRRIFGRTGEGIITFLNERISDSEKILSELPEKYYSDISAALNTLNYDISKADFRDLELMKRIISAQDDTIGALYESRERYLEEKKLAEKELLRQKLSDLKVKLEDIISKAIVENGYKIVVNKFEDLSPDEFRELGEELRKKITKGIGVAASVSNDKINLVCSVSDDLIKDKDYNAGKFISELAKELGGGGGGKPHLATAGAKDISKLDEALVNFTNRIIAELRN
jgi:alanyl-tRNA synthetase